MLKTYFYSLLILSLLSGCGIAMAMEEQSETTSATINGKNKRKYQSIETNNHQSNLEEEEQEYASSNNIADDARVEQEKQTLLALYDLVTADPEILKKSLIEVVSNSTYSDDIILKFISQFKGNLDALDEQGRTALYIAASNDKQKTVDGLGMRGANVNIPNSEGLSPIHVATKQKNLPIVFTLLAHQALVSPKTLTGTTPLHIAVENKDLPLVSLLLTAGADISAMDNNKNTPMSLVIASRNADLIKTFVEKKFKQDNNLQDTQN